MSRQWDLAAIAGLRESLDRAENETHYTERKHFADAITMTEAEQNAPGGCDLSTTRLHYASIARAYAMKVAAAKDALDRLDELMRQLDRVDVRYQRADTALENYAEHVKQFHPDLLTNQP